MPTFQPLARSGPRPALPWTLPALLVLALAPAACVDGAGGAGDAGPAGVDEPERWTLEPDLRIGSVDGADALSPVRQVAPGPGGATYVVLPREQRVAVFAPDGAPAGSVGREGEGPGEFVSPSWAGFRGDTLWVYDGRQRRISFFTPDGEHLDDRPVPPDVDGMGPDERTAFGTLLADGRALFVTSAGFASPLEGTDHPFPLVAVPLAGGAPDTLATRYTAHDRAMFVSGTADNITSVQILQQVFTDVTTWAAAPDGGWVVLVDRKAAEEPAAATYRVTRVGIDGDTAFSVDVPYEPVAVEPARVDSILTSYGRSGRSESEIRDVLFLPDFLPPASDVVAAADGSVWVGREDVPDAPRAWDVFDTGGTLVARAETPPGFDLHAADGDALLGVEHDELDVPYVVRYRVVR